MYAGPIVSLTRSSGQVEECVKPCLFLVGQTESEHTAGISAFSQQIE
jgi:hypothetical protein